MALSSVMTSCCTADVSSTSANLPSWRRVWAVHSLVFGWRGSITLVSSGGVAVPTGSVLPFTATSHVDWEGTPRVPAISEYKDSPFLEHREDSGLCLGVIMLVCRKLEDRWSGILFIPLKLLLVNIFKSKQGLSQVKRPMPESRYFMISQTLRQCIH